MGATHFTEKLVYRIIFMLDYSNVLVNLDATNLLPQGSSTHVDVNPAALTAAVAIQWLKLNDYLASDTHRKLACQFGAESTSLSSDISLLVDGYLVRHVPERAGLTWRPGDTVHLLECWSTGSRSSTTCCHPDLIPEIFKLKGLPQICTTDQRHDILEIITLFTGHSDFVSLYGRLNLQL